MSIKKEIQAVLERDFENYLEELKSLVKIPSVSFDGFDKLHIKDCAEAVVDLFKKNAFENVKFLDTGTKSPAVFGELKGNPKLPSILLYAHYDVQPPMRAELWHSPAFEPQVREGRLYARGAADDKAGIIVHLAAAKIAFEVINAKINSATHAQDENTAKMPTLKFLIEGEEEVGSPNLNALLEKYKKELKCDAAIVCDAANFSEEVPAVIASLRGMIAVDVEVKSMNAPLHSGMWSGPIPDPVQGLAKMIASLSDENGSCNFWLPAPNSAPNITQAAQNNDAKTKRQPYYSEQILRKESGLLPNTKILVPENEILNSIWSEPSLTVTTIQAGDRKNAGNVLQNSAYARISLRVPPKFDLAKIEHALIERLKTNCPWGLELSLNVEGGTAEAWETKTEHPLFQKMLSALEFGYGEQPLVTGCGASIPLVPALAKAFTISSHSSGDENSYCRESIPIILTGIEDPKTNAHGENESVSLDVLKKAILSEAAFFAGLT